MIQTADEISHMYGRQFHILNSNYLLSLLAKACSESCVQPQLNQIVSELYGQLLAHICAKEFSYQTLSCLTRMSHTHPAISLEAPIPLPEASAVVVNIARAGTWPSHVCYDRLNYFMNPNKVRQDHIFASRLTNEKAQVVGTQLLQAKIGGSVEGAYLLIPDPMGATGHTLISVIEHYKKEVPGKPLKIIALHLIVTPEYLKRIKHTHEDVVVYALRVDRGLSSERALASRPGKYWEEEVGLNANHYIVPGGGGLGEVLNNSFV